MNYYQHHIGDFIRDTARLSDSQCMAYLRLMWMYYETESPFENDIDAIAFKIGANASDVSQILKHFFFLHDGKWHQARCDKEILGFREKSDKAKKSANARWENANAMRSDSERNADEPLSDANQEPVTSNQEPVFNICAEPSATTPSITLTLNNKTEFPIFDHQIAEWQELYPAADVRQELRNMRGWLLANPQKRKTKSGILRFVTSWLAKEQNRGGKHETHKPNGQHLTPVQRVERDFAELERKQKDLDGGGADLRGSLAN
jgi:uncharacterized protein YdaU (DUF1376 family)